MRCLSFLLSALVTLALAPTAAGQAASESPRTISVTGEGEIQAKPDEATISVGVTTEDESAAAAVDQNNQAMQKLLASLKESDIASRDIQTTSFDVSPTYRHDQQRQQPPKIVGYRVTNQVRVKVRQLEKFGEVLDKVVASGANTISGIQFSVSDAEQRLDEARRKAVENARHKAELLAKAADVMLGPPQEIREQSTSGPQPYRARNLQMAAADRSVPIESGEQTLSAQVHVTYSLTGGGDSDKAK